LYTKDGEPITYQGGWLAVDGGYQKYACFIHPMHNRFGFPEVVISEWLESVRKDVECAFGILKIRFRFLRNPVVYQDADMLLEYDGLTDLKWENIDPDNDSIDNDEEDFYQDDQDELLNLPLEIRDHQLPRFESYASYKYDSVREAIKDHFYFMYMKGRVH